MPPLEPTTSPSVDLARIRAGLSRIEGKAGQNQIIQDMRALLAEVARLQAQVVALVDDCDRSAADAQHWSDVARAQNAQVASMREVAEAAKVVADDEFYSAEHYQNLRLAVARLDATPQPQGDGQTREEAGR